MGIQQDAGELLVYIYQQYTGNGIEMISENDIIKDGHSNGTEPF